MDYADYVNGIGILLLLLWALVLGIDLRRAIASIRVAISEIQNAISDVRAAVSKSEDAISEIRNNLSTVESEVGEILVRLSAYGPHHRFLVKGPHHHYPYCHSPEQYSIWAYRQGKWQLDRECSAAGFEAGPPPQRKGWYEGEVVKTLGIRKGEG